MTTHLLRFAFLLLTAVNLQAQAPGPLTPPAGPIGPGMKSLEQLDAGIPLDPAQFPATGHVITQSGSYYLIGNVTAILATEAAITISASDVTLDLRGFSVIPSSGSGASSADSAIVIGAGLSNVTVRNGAIIGPWYAGIFSSSPNCTVRGVRVANTNAYGIRLTDGAQVFDCHAEGNGVTGGTSGTVSLAGISVALHSLVKNSTAARCGGDGISAGTRSLVLNCAGHDNGGDGIQGFNGAVISRTSTTRNTGRGIFVADGCVFSEVTSKDNGTAGLVGDEGCVVSRATGAENGTAGFQFGQHIAMSDCNATDNAGAGIIVGTGSAVRNCAAGANVDDGFRIGGSSVVQNCSAQSNGRAAGNTDADGFELTSTSRVSHCAAQWNAGAGFRASSFSHYFDSITAVLNGGSTWDDVVLPNNSNIVIWSRISSITPAAANYIGPFNDARTLKPFSNF